MNKLLITLLILVCAGCAPVNKTAATKPASVIVSPAATIATPKNGVIDMPADTAVAVDQASKASVPSSQNAVVRQKPLPGVQIYPGSLKNNISRIAAHYGWHQVVWDAPDDFVWVGTATIQGENLTAVLRQLLADYPLQAIFFQGNHVLYIHSRTLK